MRVVTLNVRNPSFDDGPDSWPHRREAFFETLRQLDPDVLCLQETHTRHLEEIQRELPGRLAFGIPREEGEYAEMCAVLVREWMVADCSNTEWLGETPDVPGALGWDARCPRVLTWVDLGPFAVLNTHLDHVGLFARRNGMAQVLRRADALDKPCLIAGDFNAPPDEPALSLAREAGFVDLAEGTGPTFHGFRKPSKHTQSIAQLWDRIDRIRDLAKRETDPQRRQELLRGANDIGHRALQYEQLAFPDSTRIDYLLARGPWHCERVWVERGDYSDHWAVGADVSLTDSSR